MSSQSAGAPSSEELALFKEAWITATQTYLIFSRPRFVTTIQGVIDILAVVFPVGSIMLLHEVFPKGWEPESQRIVDAIGIVLGLLAFVSLVRRWPAAVMLTEDDALDAAHYIAEIQSVGPPPQSHYTAETFKELKALSSSAGEAGRRADFRGHVMRCECWLAKRAAEKRFAKRYPHLR